MKPHERTIGIGLAGCGQLARTAHLGILGRLPGARLAAVAEPDEGRRAAAAARAPGAEAVADYRELLALDAVDAVVLALPPAFHAAAAVAALEAGKHVYVEKPLATEPDAARRVLAAWRASGRVGMIGFNYRFNRLYRQAREALAGGGLGRPLAVTSIFTTGYRASGDWRRSRASGGGALLDLGSHHVDLVRWLLGEEVSEVEGAHGSEAGEGDTSTLRLRLTGGALVQSLFSHGVTDDDRIEIHCERGRVRVDRGGGLAAEVSAGRPETRRRDQLRNLWRSVRGIGYGLEKRRALGHEPSWRTALERFVGAARGEAPASPDLEDGWRSLEVLLAAEASARSGRVVELAARRETGATLD